MGTREDCKNGDCTSDNQGFCWWCGSLVNPDWYEAYCGDQHPVPVHDDLSAPCLPMRKQDGDA
jgi:hypothetical protein